MDYSERPTLGDDNRRMKLPSEAEKKEKRSTIPVFSTDRLFRDRTQKDRHFEEADRLQSRRIREHFRHAQAEQQEED